MRIQSLVNWHQFTGWGVGGLVSLEFSWRCMCNTGKNYGFINDGSPVWCSLPEAASLRSLIIWFCHWVLEKAAEASARPAEMTTYFSCSNKFSAWADSLEGVISYGLKKNSSFSQKEPENRPIYIKLEVCNIIQPISYLAN